MKYPIGIQTFEEIRRDDWAYVDKTAYIHRMVNGGKFYFLSRPRRFGKSLFLSTLDAYFSGRQELFEGLALASLEHDWVQYPILRFDFNTLDCSCPDNLEKSLTNRLMDLEDNFGIPHLENAVTSGERFGMLISRIAAKYGQRVVVLVDEYDKAILDIIERDDLLAENQRILRNFYIQLKGHDADIRFCMITGVARFRHLTIFSGLNNINDISLDDKYAALCGITDDELEQTFSFSIRQLSAEIDKSIEEVRSALHIKYNGYRFSRKKITVYNPFSLLNCFEHLDLNDYWVMSGTSMTFVKYLSHAHYDLNRIEKYWASGTELGSLFTDTNPVPLLYQTGYMTICDYDDGMYRIGFPNGEVRNALVSELLPIYVGKRDNINYSLMQLRRKIIRQDIDGFMTELQSLIAATPHQEFQYDNLEKTYHLMMYFIFLMLGISTESEISTSGGRIDMVAQTREFVYVFEFKLDTPAATALAQIDQKGYALAWSADGRPVYKIGVCFSSKTRTISEWKVRRC